MKGKLAALCALLLCALPLSAQDPATLGRVIEAAQQPSLLEQNLEVLTDQIGGRIPGTPAMNRAVGWGVSAFQAAGADKVTTELFTLPTSWAEGDTQVEVVAPDRFRVRAVSLAWAPALAPRKLRFVDVGNGTAEDFAKAGDFAGAVLLVHSETMKTWDDLFAEYLRTPAVVQNALAGRAAAIAFLSTREHDLLYRHISSFDGRIAPLPMLLLAREDGLRISRLLAQGPVEAQVSIPNKIGGVTPTANVVAALEGSEHPEEWVLLGAHLDSWELGTGALDNGCNAALVIDVLRALRSAGVKPRRSIRFVLFSGEEEGTLGSHDYVVRHRNELDHAVAAVILDEGTGQITGWSLGGREDVAQEFDRLAQPLSAFHAGQQTTDAFYGTDNFDFLLEGVPTLVANQVEANYLPNYHASSDTFDKVDLGALRQHVAITAALIYELADAPERLGPRQSRAEIEELLRRTHLDEQMKTFGYWEDWETGRLGREPEKPPVKVITDRPE